MDPNQTFLDMFEAMKAEGFSTAHRLCLAEVLRQPASDRARLKAFPYVSKPGHITA
jgi:hypothetical protein